MLPPLISCAAFISLAWHLPTRRPVKSLPPWERPRCQRHNQMRNPGGLDFAPHPLYIPTRPLPTTGCFLSWRCIGNVQLGNEGDVCYVALGKASFQDLCLTREKHRAPCVLNTVHYVFWTPCTMCSEHRAPCGLNTVHHVVWTPCTMCSEHRAPCVLNTVHHVFWTPCTMCSEHRALCVLNTVHYVFWTPCTMCSEHRAPCVLNTVHYVFWTPCTMCSEHRAPCVLSSYCELKFVCCLFVGCLTSQQHASVPRGTKGQLSY